MEGRSSRARSRTIRQLATPPREGGRGRCNGRSRSPPSRPRGRREEEHPGTSHRQRRSCDHVGHHVDRYRSRSRLSHGADHNDQTSERRGSNRHDSRCHPHRPSRSRERSTRSRRSRSHSKRPRFKEQVRSEQPPLTINDLSAIMNSIASSKQPSYHTNVVPSFDPSLPSHRIDLWLNKVNQCAYLYGWDDKQVIHFALQKLAGNARTWYDSLPTMVFTWKEWQDKLLSAFPWEQNYGRLLDDMTKRKYRIGESVENYYYEKMSLLNQCQITGRHAVDCIVYGLTDRTLRTTAQSLRCKEPEELLEFLTSSKEFYTSYKQTDSRNKTDNNNSNNKTSQLCFNCHERGHVHYNCKKPIIKCTKCNKIGHNAENCRSQPRIQENTKSTMAITGKTNNNKYYKSVLIDEREFQAFVDLGSEVTIIQASKLEHLNKNINHSNIKSIKSFGNMIIPTLGQINIKISIDDVVGQVDAVVVDDSYLNVPILIGQDFTDQNHVLIVKDSQALKFHSLHTELPTFTESNVTKRVSLCSTKDINVLNQCLIEVSTEPCYTGDLIVETNVIGQDGSEVVIKGGIYSFDANGRGNVIGFRCGSVANLQNGTTVARGQPFTEIPSCYRIERELCCDTSNLPIEQIKIGSDIAIEDKERLVTLLNDYRTCFAMNLRELGCSKDTEIKIELNDNKPVVYRPYRLPNVERQVVRDMVNELLDTKIIQESTSDYASPVLLVKKKNGKYRLCIDYRSLNNKTVKERYPMPIIDEQISRLAGQKYFSALDLASGYYQVPVALESQHLTAFVTPDGQYEFKRMPFGLANAPAVFQRLINKVLGAARFTDALTYMDDVLIPSATVDEGLDKLRKILDIFSKANLTLNLEKCLFLSENLDYLGYEISVAGVRPGTKKIESVQQFPEPQNQHQVRQFYGLVSYFRKFIYNFASIAQPLSYLLKKDVPFRWQDDQKHAFESLKEKLSSRPILSIYDPNAKYTEVHTDASKHGLAGILLQKANDTDQMRVVAYYSRQTSPEEKHFHAYELETLAVVDSLKKFRVYLLGTPFKVITDCRALRTTLTKRDLIPRIARWWLQLQEFQYEIEYRPGTKMSHVDALSRNLTDSTTEKEISLHNDFLPNVMQIEVDNWLLTLQLGDHELNRIRKILTDNDSLTEVKSIKLAADTAAYYCGYCGPLLRTLRLIPADTAGMRGADCGLCGQTLRTLQPLQGSAAVTAATHPAVTAD
ncbi:unnamed protein product [Plutella xylostella]|uniref:RNA-directed DNA polymerase n=1 Tax=Plutella xylostella TaxID=51655 RepID=A0A8S4FYG1_PLUXY|nr:unnamed protein product [Plutella xylostella]